MAARNPSWPDCIQAPGDIATAWDLIGFDGACRVANGGRSEWESVDYDASRNGSTVRLSRAIVTGHGLRVATRYVHPDTQLQVLA